MADTEVAGETTAHDPVDDPAATASLASHGVRREPVREPVIVPIVTPPFMSSSLRGSPLQTANATMRDHTPRRRPTIWQHTLRGLVIGVSALISVVLLAPLVTALVAALWALVTEMIATLTIVRLVHQGSFLQTVDAMGALSVASRVGFAAIGYLGLYCSLLALQAGLLGRGRGRLFVIPGALLTASALVLFAVSIALCWPLLAPLQAPRALLIGVALYLIVDTVALAALLVDARETRRRWSVRRRSRSHAPRPAQAPEQPRPPALPPTLAGA